MKQMMIGLLFFLFFQMPIEADYIVMAEGEVLEGDNLHHVQSVASISKIMSALIALEYGQIGDVVTIDHETTQQIGSSLYLLENEQYTLLSLIYGLMLRSGNDAAYAIAQHVGLTQDGFVNLMNRKAEELGMKDTLFVNPSGLDEVDGGNLSSVYDMALCMSAAMKNELFRMIVSTHQYKAENQRIWINKNRLLSLYESCIGGKTGYTVKAGKTLVTSSNENNVESIVVSFQEGEYYLLHKRLHEQASMNYERILLVEKGFYKLKNKRFYIPEDIYALVLHGEKAEAEITLEASYVQICYRQLDHKIERKEVLR